MTELAERAVEVEGPTTTSVVRREPLPKELEALGVKVAVDDASGMQLLIVPKQMREKFNVLTPVQAFQQADPNWRPSIRVVELNPSKDGEHFYKQGQNLAPRKQALELLADAAGMVDTRVSLIGRERVEVGGVVAETFTHVATAKIRKSDGTLRTLEASKTYEPFAEYEEIRTSVGTGNYAKTPGSDEYDAEVRKRWLNEIKFAKAKNESKAILRAIRSALQIPHTFSAGNAAKPFVVVGWNLAPQDTDSVHAAIAQLYGAQPAEIAAPTVERAWGVEPPIEVDEHDVIVQEEEDGTSEGQQAVAAAPQPPEEEAATVPGADEAADVEVEAAEVEAEPEIEGVEPVVEEEAEVVEVDAVEEPDEEQDDPAAIAEALEVKIPAGSHQGRTIGWVLELGDKADEWLAYALKQPWPQDQQFHAALVVACKAQRSDLYAAWRSESE